MKHSLDTLKARYEMPGQISMGEGAGGLMSVTLRSEWGESTVSLHGGHVLTYVPSGQKPVLWLSDHSRYEAGKAIRGGIPLIWPWFGPHKNSSDKPNHGFARTHTWHIHSTRIIDGTSPQVRLVMTDDALTHSLWPQSFHLEVVVTLADSLKVDLEITNQDQVPFTFTGALHSYFDVSHIENIEIHGLEGSTYIDQLRPEAQHVQEGPITFSSETDHIYLDTPATCTLIDREYERVIIVEKSGSQSTVVWNPWIDKAARMSDFGDDEYKRMVCIETANAGTDEITLNPGDRHILSTTLRAEKWQKK